MKNHVRFWLQLSWTWDKGALISVINTSWNQIKSDLYDIWSLHQSSMPDEDNVLLHTTLYTHENNRPIVGIMLGNPQSQQVFTICMLIQKWLDAIRVLHNDHADTFHEWICCIPRPTLIMNYGVSIYLGATCWDQRSKSQDVNTESRN